MTTWTDERIELMKKLWKDGKSATEIAEQLGNVSRAAVLGKLSREGLLRVARGKASPLRSFG